MKQLTEPQFNQMKFLIKFTFLKCDEVVKAEMRVSAEDVRSALRMVESDLDVLGAKVESVIPWEI